MAAPKKTGEELADAILAAPYDPSFLNGWFVNLVGLIADGRTVKPARQAARSSLEALADHEAFLAEHEYARKTR